MRWDGPEPKTPTCPEYVDPTENRRAEPIEADHSLLALRAARDVLTLIIAASNGDKKLFRASVAQARAAMPLVLVAITKATEANK